jgi:uncharacterized protein
MILTRDYNRGDYQINSYEPGKLVINGQLHTQSMIVSAKSLFEWQPQSFNELTKKHLEIILTLKPEIVLLGTGKTIIIPEAGILADFINDNIGVEFMDTSAACRTFNVLMSESRNVVAALLIK